MKKNTVYNGFYFTMRGKDVFVITDVTRKTEKLFKQICKKFLLPDNASTIDALKYCMRRATLQIKELSNGRLYNEISGENFSGYGHFIDEDKDVVVIL